MPFQTQVNATPAPGIPGTFASANPYATIDAGPGGLTAGAAAVTGLFNWIVQATQTVESVCPTAPLSVPDGFLADNHQGLITTWLGAASTLIPQGLGVTLFDRGDFWASNLFAPASVNQKVFVNKVGQIVGAAAGSFVTTDVSAASPVISSGSISGSVLTVVTGSGLEVGQSLTDPNTLALIGYITSLGSGTGGAGTYNLNQTATYPAASAFTVAGQPATGATGTASFATSVMTVTALTTGHFAVGQFISSAGVAAGTYITSLGTGTGGTGTYNLSTSPGTISAQAVSASGWIETPWSIKSAGNVGDVVKIGVRN